MKKKRLVAMGLAAVMTLCMAACSSTETKPADQGETTAKAAEAQTEAQKEQQAAPAQDMGPIFTDLVENGVLRVGIIGNDPTFCYHTIEDGKDVLAGFEVAGMYEMAKRLTDYLGREVTVDFYESDFTGCMSALESKKIFFVTRLAPTEERIKTWLFTDVYHKSDECYVALKDNVDNEKFGGTLEGVTVAAQMGSTDVIFTNFKYPDAQIEELPMVSDLLLAVKNKKVDLAAMNAVSAAMSVEANDDLALVEKICWAPGDDLDKGCGLCMAYGNEDFAEWCNGFFSDIRAEGLWAQMQDDAASSLDAEALKAFTVK